MKDILKLDSNKVWRTYLGGKLLDEFLGSKNPEDSHFPEMWIGSVVEANNPTNINMEGLSIISSDSEIKKTLKDVILDYPEYYLGEQHIQQHGSEMGMLVKLLDSSERLTIQVHPDKEKALSLFDSKFGKTEAWIVQGGRIIDGEKPHIFFGFKKGITRQKWEDVFFSQNIEEMLNLMHKVYVNIGDVFLIEGGMPHAIGAGCFILEIQEPTDLTIRTERTTPNGYNIPDNLIHQGIGFDKMFDCFHYAGTTKDELKRWTLEPKKTDLKNIKSLISYNDTKCFAIEEIVVTSEFNLPSANTLSILVILDGAGSITFKNEVTPLEKGDQIVIPMGKKIILNTACNDLRMMRCYPPANN